MCSLACAPHQATCLACVWSLLSLPAPAGRRSHLDSVSTGGLMWRVSEGGMDYHPSSWVFLAPGTVPEVGWSLLFTHRGLCMLHACLDHPTACLPRAPCALCLVTFRDQELTPFSDNLLSISYRKYFLLTVDSITDVPPALPLHLPPPSPHTPFHF